mgnify:CR=1 FL=1
MSSYTDVRSLILSNIKANGQGEITGPILQDVLLKMLENSSRVEEITYSNLKTLRNSANLTPSRLYRITDYITTTSQAYTQSAGHPFDVIVLALSESELSEQAWAIQSARDTGGYFANSKLSAWRIWYCLDNDTERFAWAGSGTGKGVIYRMIDEWNNDLPYDFKNIKFVRYELNAPDEYESSGYADAWMEQLSKNIRARFNNDIKSYIWAGVSSGGRCWEDEAGLVCSSSTGVSKAFYTFTTDNDEDGSLLASCSNNKMLSTRTLPNNVFFGSYHANNNFGAYCLYNTFGDDCSYNNFGAYCTSNTFGFSCSSNSFGDECSNNSFGDYNYYNHFGNSCNQNSFNESCSSNIFSNGSYANSFGDECGNNSFGNEYNYNSFGNACSYNIFGNSCTYNIFGNFCRYNSFGNSCNINRFGIYYRYNKGDNGVSVNLSNNQTASYNQQVQNYHFTRGLKSQAIEIEVERNRAYETTVAVNSSGSVKQFCIADLVADIQVNLNFSGTTTLAQAGMTTQLQYYALIGGNASLYINGQSYNPYTVTRDDGEFNPYYKIESAGKTTLWVDAELYNEDLTDTNISFNKEDLDEYH